MNNLFFLIIFFFSNSILLAQNISGQYTGCHLRTSYTYEFKEGKYSYNINGHHDVATYFGNYKIHGDTLILIEEGNEYYTLFMINEDSCITDFATRFQYCKLEYYPEDEEGFILCGERIAKLNYPHYDTDSITIKSFYKVFDLSLQYLIANRLVALDDKDSLLLNAYFKIDSSYQYINPDIHLNFTNKVSSEVLHIEDVFLQEKSFEITFEVNHFTVKLKFRKVVDRWIIDKMNCQIFDSLSLKTRIEYTRKSFKNDLLFFYFDKLKNKSDFDFENNESLIIEYSDDNGLGKHTVLWININEKVFAVFDKNHLKKIKKNEPENNEYNDLKNKLMNEFPQQENNITVYPGIIYSITILNPKKHYYKSFQFESSSFLEIEH